MVFKSDKQRKAVMAKLNQGYVRSDVKPVLQPTGKFRRLLKKKRVKMGLKDWKIFGKNSSITTWIKKKDDFGDNPHLNGTTVSVGVNTDWDWDKKRLTKGGYDVEIDNKGFKKSSKWFKTKPKALKYAKMYRKQH